MEELIEIKDVQKILLEDYMQVCHIWEKRGYQYFLTGGSVLGAVRHHGFIPWDDDLDVGLPRKDYEDFVEHGSKSLPPYLQLVWRARGQQYLIMDTRYRVNYNEEAQDSLLDGKDEVGHPCLDLQVFDGTPNNLIARYCFCAYVMFLRVVIKMNEPEKIHEGNWRPGWENLLIRILKKLSFVFPKNKNKVSCYYEKVKKKYPYEKSRYIADFVGKYHFRDVYPKAWWEPGKEVEFENIKTRIPSGYHKYLTQIYGDYMKIPKKEMRVTHLENNIGEIKNG